MKEFETIDGATPMSQPLRPPPFIVDRLLAQGLHLLAGSPKVGKSWLALWLAVTVAKGEPVWGMATRQGTTATSGAVDSSLFWQRRGAAATGPACSVWGGTSSTRSWNWSATPTTCGSCALTVGNSRRCWRIGLCFCSRHGCRTTRILSALRRSWHSRSTLTAGRGSRQGRCPVRFCKVLTP